MQLRSQPGGDSLREWRTGGGPGRVRTVCGLLCAGCHVRVGCVTLSQVCQLAGGDTPRLVLIGAVERHVPGIVVMKTQASTLAHMS